MENGSLHKGRRALSEGQWHEAKKLLEYAVQERPCAEAFEELAQACWWVNDIAAVLEHREKAYQLYLEKGDKYGAARNACSLGIDNLELRGEFALANGWFHRAETLLQGLGPCPELGIMMLLKGRKAFISEPTNENALLFLNESIRVCRAVGSIDGSMMAEAMKGFLLTTEGHVPEGMALLDEATLIATSNETKNINFVTLTCCMLIEACERVRDFDRAGQWCRRVKEICSRWHFDAMFSSCRNLYASVLVWRGEWQEAESELLAARQELEKLRPSYTTASIVRLADLRRRQGKWDETRNLLDEAGSHTLKFLHCSALAFDQEDYGVAEDFAGRFLRQVPAKEKTRKLGGLELLLRIYLAQERADEATTVLNELKEIAAMIDTPPVKAAIKSAEGIVQQSRGRYESAKLLLEDAIDLYDAVNAPFEAARTRQELSNVLVALGQFRLAEAELKKALKIFQKLGAEKDVEKTRLQLKHMHKTNAELQAMDKKLELTGRELEVLRLIAEGKNNEEIAEQLFLSVRTIEKHITNLYLKMGVSGKSARAFAASYAIRHHLVFS